MAPSRGGTGARALLSLAAVTTLLASIPGRGPEAAQTQRPPALVVVLVIDQMRFDYVDRMRAHWTSGLARLVNDGAVFDRTAYPYLQTVTCSGHATIASGTFPATHGIILNAWWRGTRNASCTADAAVHTVPYEPDAEPVGHSASQLLVPTLADRLRGASPGSRVAAVSLKPRSAIMLAGRAGVVTWLDEHDRWATSSAYTAAPHAVVQAFLASHPREADRAATWTRLLDAAAYQGTDDAAAEAPPAGWTSVFPHPLAGSPGASPPRFETLWETSPYADAYLGDMAAALVRGLHLGQRGVVDYLGVSFSALDYVGHAFGPDSHEVQDTLLRLDQTVGRLLAMLDQHVGPGRYLVGLSADHGVAPIPDARVAAGLPGGRIATSALARAAEDALVHTLGPGPHIARVEYTQVYLSEAAARRAAADSGVLLPAIRALERVPGVARVLTGAGLESQRQTADAQVRAAALSHVPGRSGQLVVIPEPYFTLGPAAATGSTHGTHHAYDQHVPLIFYGPGIRPGRYSVPSTPADLSTTLAFAIGLDLPDAEGTVHRQIFRTP